MPCAPPGPPHPQCPVSGPGLDHSHRSHVSLRWWYRAWGTQASSVPCTSSNCMDEWWVRADHASFPSLRGRPVWPQLPGDVPESPGLPGAELLPARPLRLLLRLGLERLPLRPRYRDIMGVHQLSPPAWASSRAWLLSSSTSANLSASEGGHRLSSAAACISCLLSL